MIAGTLHSVNLIPVAGFCRTARLRYRPAQLAGDAVEEPRLVILSYEAEFTAFANSIFHIRARGQVHGIGSMRESPLGVCKKIAALLMHGFQS